MHRRDKLFAHVDTGSDRPSPELVTLRAARDLMRAHGYEITEIENAIAEVEEHPGIVRIKVKGRTSRTNYANHAIAPTTRRQENTR